MAELKDITKINGLTLKQLAQLSNVSNAAITKLSKKPLSEWTSNDINSIATALNMTIEEFKNAMSGKILSPFIKWVGGKRQLLPKLISFMPRDGYNNYFEPFIGGGALLLRLAPQNAVLNDSNTDLIITWQVVKDDIDELCQLLHIHEERDSKEYYLDIRSMDRDERLGTLTNVKRAARFIYMNKAGYNGLWRVNSHGQNNVPYGHHSKLNLVNDKIYAVSEYLNSANIKIRNTNYREAVVDAEANDLVYFDPPYIPVTQTSSFTSYTTSEFGLLQQEQLRDIALQLAEKGVKVMLSNADVPLIKDLYKNDVFNIHHVQANRFVNSKSDGRGKVGEVIITTY